jgi:hypothetical protein
MNETRPHAKQPERRPLLYSWLRIVTKIIVVLMLAFVLLIVLASFAVPMQMIYALAAGWLNHGLRVVPDFISKWQAALLPLAALVLAWVIGHRLIRWWLANRDHPAAGSWTMRQSGVVLGLVVMCGAAAIAFSGMAHQMMWLGQTKWMESSTRSHLMLRIHDTRQVMLMLYEFDLEHDRLPHSWDELLDWGEGAQREHLARLLLGMRPGISWSSLTLPGAETQTMNPATVLVLSDLVDGYHVTGRADMSVTRITPQQLDAMIARGNWLFEN